MQKSAKKQLGLLHSLTTSNSVPILALPQKGSTADFFKTCVTDIERSGPYAPSFAKALSSVKSFLQSAHNRLEKGRKREAESSGRERADLANEIPQLLTEYLMLHVGSAKYRRGKFATKAISEASSNDAMEPSAPFSPSPSFQTSLSQDAGTYQPPRAKADDTSDSIVLKYENKKSIQNSGSSEKVYSGKLRGLCINAPWAAFRASGGATPSLDMREVGRWGEALVYQYLLVHYPRATVTWVNKDAESMSCYDIKLEEHASDGSGHIKTTFVEVKASRFDALNVFEISPNEWAFASGSPHVHFDVYRVYNAGDVDRVYLHVVRNLLKAVTEQKVRLCLAI